MSGKSVAVRIENLGKTFDRPVLSGLTLDIHQGETFVVLGQSGTGKSVLLKILIGLLPPDSGNVEVMGESITQASDERRREIRRRFGMLFQTAALFDSLTVFENVGFSLIESGMPPVEIRERVSSRLALVLLSGVEDKYPAALSGGMRKRVGLARAIASEPPILLYDEPTTGLDPVTSAVINRLIRRVQRELSVTSIVVTHDMVSASYVGDRMGLLHEGRMRFVGSPADFESCADPIVRQFIRGEAAGPLSEQWKEDES